MDDESTLTPADLAAALADMKRLRDLQNAEEDLLSGVLAALVALACQAKRLADTLEPAVCPHGRFVCGICGG